jgi:hypothetical protein
MEDICRYCSGRGAKTLLGTSTGCGQGHLEMLQVVREQDPPWLVLQAEEEEEEEEEETRSGLKHWRRGG